MKAAGAKARRKDTMTTTIISPVAEKTFQVLADNWCNRATEQALLIAAFGAQNGKPLVPEGVSVRTGGGQYRFTGMKPRVQIEGNHRKQSRRPFRRVFPKLDKRYNDEKKVYEAYLIVSLEEVRAKVAELAVQDAEIVAANKRSSDEYEKRRSREEALKAKLGVKKERSWTDEPFYEIPGLSDISADYDEKGTFSVRLNSFSGLTEDQVAELVGLLREFRRKVSASNADEEDES